jgi:DNA-binding NarL/FixJ family response regulator
VDSEQVIHDCLEAGIRGWVVKSEGVHNLVTAVKALQQGKSIFSSRVSDFVKGGFAQQYNTPVTPNSLKLTPREHEVLQLLAEGKSSKEVATILDFATKTAETHRTNLMRKLKLHSVVELVLYAVRNEIVSVSIPSLVSVPSIAPLPRWIEIPEMVN